MSQAKYVYSFGGGDSEGDAAMKNLLGGKGANLAEMAKLGLPVPPGFTITTDVCTEYYKLGQSYPDAVGAQVKTALAQLETKVGKKFGDAADPLLVSVRSGARASMPGMMDTVLNLGLNDETVEGLAKLSGDRRFAFDSYRRFIQMYSDVVLGLDHSVFEEILGIHKDTNDYQSDVELTAEDWVAVIGEYKRAVERELERPFPYDPQEQLWGAISAVFSSWMNERAKVYRRLHDIPESWGTAVNVQAMVFGNMGETSATGVAFTRDPSTGEKRLYGEYLINAQGEDVVAGIRTPKALSKAARESMNEAGPSLEEAMPGVFQDLQAVFAKLERHYRDMQDIEFTIERGALYMLQTRSGKRTARAALRIAVEMAEEGLISRTEAVLRVDPASLDQLLHPTISEGYKRDIVCTGLPASPGAAVGVVVFDPDEAAERAQRGEAVILVRDETSPEDIHGMHAAKAIVTARGGMTSHAAVVARGMGRPCVCGITEMRIDMKGETFTARGRTVRKGDALTVDGSQGEVLAGAAEMVQPSLSGEFATLMQWADAARTMKVRANAETPEDAAQAVEFGAEGIGLCRTEHMFFDADRIAAVREMILAERQADRVTALAKILPFQRDDFEKLFEIMGDRPCTIRLLDPPLHEFLPHTEEDCEAVARATGIDAKALLARARELHEVNPMLGFRGCRLAIQYPEIYDMQARAIFEAACNVAARGAVAPVVEVMIPFVITQRELGDIRARIESVAAEIAREKLCTLACTIGTMIELPRAALRAGDIANEAEFFSFGTNDLTQSTLGLSRDDSGKFLTAYVAKGILERDPFITIDQEGVGEMIALAVERGRAARPDLKLGICGEHGGDPASVAFCQRLGLNYVSCSPFRVPVARLAAAHAALANQT
ncbi:MAG: pyruvate, phosphate dikinase [Alphaproteobacteria bacterium]|nr:pyruvate, phosphate dikinase [Alphaproteobacteria bacterium]